MLSKCSIRWLITDVWSNECQQHGSEVSVGLVSLLFQSGSTSWDGRHQLCFRHWWLFWSCLWMLIPTCDLHNGHPRPMALQHQSICFEQSHFPSSYNACTVSFKAHKLVLQFSNEFSLAKRDSFFQTDYLKRIFTIPWRVLILIRELQYKANISLQGLFSDRFLLRHQLLLRPLRGMRDRIGVEKISI